MRTKRRRILAAVLLAVSLFMLYAMPASAERYRFNSQSVKILKDMIGLMKKENVKQSAARQEKLAADLEKIRKISEPDCRIAAAILDCWENVMVNGDYPFIIYGGGEYAPELENSGIEAYDRHAFVVMGYALSYGKMQKELEDGARRPPLRPVPIRTASSSVPAVRPGEATRTSIPKPGR